MGHPGIKFSHILWLGFPADMAERWAENGWFRTGNAGEMDMVNQAFSGTITGGDNNGLEHQYPIPAGHRKVTGQTRNKTASVS